MNFYMFLISLLCVNLCAMDPARKTVAEPPEVEPEACLIEKSVLIPPYGSIRFSVIAARVVDVACPSRVKNEGGIVFIDKLRCASLFNGFYMHAPEATGVVLATRIAASLGCVKALRQLDPIDESDLDFVAHCQPDEKGCYSQLELQEGHKGSIWCDNLQPVIMHDDPVRSPKKYGAPCENDGLLQLKTLYLLIASDSPLLRSKDTEKSGDK